jgi:large subunit ribosomal protein L2
LRNKHGIWGKVIKIEQDPNRSVNIALINYADGDKKYILAPLGLKINDKVISGKKNIETKAGNSMPLSEIPIGTSIHNIEMHPGKGGQIVRGAGTLAIILAKEDNFAHVKMPSGEVRKIKLECFASIGQLSNVEEKTKNLRKAGRSRLLGRRPVVRGTAQNPRSHPHGGGEGRSGEGLKSSKTPWGKVARGKKTRKKFKYSNKFIIKKRNK